MNLHNQNKMIFKNIFLVVAILLYASSRAEANLWNQLISLNGVIQQEDFSLGPSFGKNSKFYQSQYQISLLSDHTVEVSIESNDNNPPLLIKGSYMFDEEISLSSNSYELKANAQKIKGKVVYETGWGVSWNYKIELSQQGLLIERNQIKHAYLSIILMIGFGISGLAIFSISDRARVTTLYNLRKRTHPVTLMVIVLKAFWVLCCFIFIGYSSIKSLSIWVMLVLYGVYLFSLSPSIIHILYLVSAAQKGLSEIQFYKSKQNKLQFMIVISSILTFTIVFFASFSFHKGILFFYLLSLNTAFIYIYSCIVKKFAYGPLIIYDSVLTFTLCILSLFLPIGNFVLISYKQFVLFLNFSLFLFAFGMIFMKKIIKNELVEEIQLSEFSTRQSDAIHTESERRGQYNEGKPPQSNQLIQQ